jgi:hypothetical protein
MPKLPKQITPAPDVTSMALGGIRTAIAKAPVLGVIAKFAEEVEAERRRRRKAEWASALADGEDEASFASRLEAALGGPDAELVRAAVLESAQAAAGAIVDAAVPCIARLTNRFLTTDAIELRMYRIALEMLRAIQEDELGALRTGLPAMRALGTDPVDTFLELVINPAGERRGEWRACATRPETVLLADELAVRVVAALYPLSQDAFHVYANAGAPRQRPQFPLSVVELLGDATGG